MSQDRNFWMRWRVRTSYPLAVLYWLLATPSPASIRMGGVIAVVGLVIRAAAAGHLRKFEALATTGPYARTRNPLYFGSAFLALGFAIASRSWLAGLLVVAYFAIFYYAVMRNEEAGLRRLYGSAFGEYAARVPLFFPRITGPREMSPGSSEGSSFSWPQYRRNREYKALIGTVLALATLWLRMWIRAKWSR